jgi:outer membrane receptor for ferric coprogen and ferric-rhodotorulic acid
MRPHCTASARRPLRLRAIRLLAAWVGLFSVAVVRAEPVKFNIPAQVATDALVAFSKQTGIDVLYPSPELKKVKTPAVVGRLEPEAALKILLAGTGFQATKEGGKFLVRPIGQAAGSVSGRMILLRRDGSVGQVTITVFRRDRTKSVRAS